jgi:hypothetical protein
MANDKRRLWAQKNQDRIRLQRKVWCAANPDRVRQYDRIRKKAYPDRAWRMRLKREYGLSIEEYNTLLNQQNGVCAICHKPETKKTKGVVGRLSVDHIHSNPDGSGPVRGLLCNKCNAVLGLIYDSPDIARQIIEYLRPWENFNV